MKILEMNKEKNKESLPRVLIVLKTIFLDAYFFIYLYDRYKE